MGKPKLYHILYADEMRLDSLDAQLHGEVPVRKTLSDSSSNTVDKTLGGGIPSIAEGSATSSQQETKEQSLEYTFRDARYFYVMEKIGVDLKKPETSLSYVPDGEIHVFRGKLQIVSLSSAKPMIETLKAIFSGIKKNPAILGLKPGKDATKNFQEAEIIADLMMKIPAPPSFRLMMGNGDSLYGPIIESAVRLPLIDQTIIFGSALPFDWTIVGYLYPSGTSFETGENPGFLFQMATALETMRPFINPPSDATLIPLLILR